MKKFKIYSIDLLSSFIFFVLSPLSQEDRPASALQPSGLPLALLHKDLRPEQKYRNIYICGGDTIYIYSETQCTIANDLIGHIIVCPSNFPCLIKCLQFTELVELYLWHMSNYATRHPT